MPADDLRDKVALLDARLTALERRIEQLSAPPVTPESAAAPTGASVTCGEPGLLINQAYAVERNGMGTEFRWIGNDGPIQMIIPIMPVRRLTCCLRLLPHPRVDFSDLTIRANDVDRPTLVSRDGEGALEIYFNMDADGLPFIHVLLSGIRSVRPQEIGENDDSRLLAARFYGAEITYTAL